MSPFPNRFPFRALPALLGWAVLSLAIPMPVHESPDDGIPMSYVFMAMGYGLVVLVMAIAIVILRKEARRMRELAASLQEQKELLQVFTEGVETEDQWKILRLLKCDMAQGYYFCKALSPRDVEKFLEQ